MAAFIVVAAGCGGAPADPFPRGDVTGAVTLDGKPLPYGELAFRQSVESDTVTELAQATCEVRSGVFESSPAGRPALGPNSVVLVVFDGVPPPPAAPAGADEEESDVLEPQIRGYWSSEVDIAAGARLTFDVKSKDLKKNPPE